MAPYSYSLESCTAKCNGFTDAENIVRDPALNNPKVNRGMREGLRALAF